MDCTKSAQKPENKVKQMDGETHARMRKNVTREAVGKAGQARPFFNDLLSAGLFVSTLLGFSLAVFLVRIWLLHARAIPPEDRHKHSL